MRSVSTRGIQSKQRYLTDIGERVPPETDKIDAFSRCHGVWSNIWAVSWVFVQFDRF